jgi:hypothetical protein
MAYVKTLHCFGDRCYFNGDPVPTENITACGVSVATILDGINHVGVDMFALQPKHGWKRLEELDARRAAVSGSDDLDHPFLTRAYITDYAGALVFAEWTSLPVYYNGALEAYAVKVCPRDFHIIPIQQHNSYDEVDAAENRETPFVLSQSEAGDLLI